MILGLGLEACQGFEVGVASFGAVLIECVLFFPKFVYEFSVCFVDDRGDGFVA